MRKAVFGRAKDGLSVYKQKPLASLQANTEAAAIMLYCYVLPRFAYSFPPVCAFKIYKDSIFAANRKGRSGFFTNDDAVI